MRQGWLLNGAFVAPVLIASSMAFACGAGPNGELACIPGLAIIAFHVGMLLPILAGVLERRFFTLAGMDRRHVWLAIWLNALASLLVNIAGPFVLMNARSDEAAVAWVALAVAGGAGLKYLWLRRRVRLTGPVVGFVFVLLGSIVSAAVIGCLPLLRQALAPWSYSGRYVRAVQSWEPLLVLGTIGVSLVVYGVAFRRTRDITPLPPAERRGFEVVLQPASPV